MKNLDPRAIWLFFISYLLRWLLPFLFMGGYLCYIVWEGDWLETTGQFIVWVWIILILLIALAYVWAYLSYRFYKYELTEDAFKKELGVIYKKYVSIPYDRIQNVDIYRGIISRLLGLSDLHIQTAGSSAQVYGYAAYGLGAEGRLPGLSKIDAEKLRDELIQRAKSTKNRGL